MTAALHAQERAETSEVVAGQVGPRVVSTVAARREGGAVRSPVTQVDVNPNIQYLTRERYRV